jgi:hypothetical protein
LYQILSKASALNKGQRMRKIDLILENIRDEYMINLLEEGEATELQTLKTKKFLNENLAVIRSMLIEEGALDGVKQHLANNWGKYLAGAGAAGLGAYGYTHPEAVEAIKDQAGQAYREMTGNETLGDKVASGARWATGNENLVDKAGNLIGTAGEGISNAADYVGDKLNAAGEYIGDKASELNAATGGYAAPVAGAAALGAGGYGAKKLYDRYNRK